MLPEIGEGWQPAATGSLGARLGSGSTFLELQSVMPEWEVEDVREGNRSYDCNGWLMAHTLNFGAEWHPTGWANWRTRAHVGLGYFHTNGFRDDDSGLATTIGAALQYRLWSTGWAQLGAAHYGLYSDLDRDDETFRHNLFLDLSLVIDF